ncbi:MAG: DOPA 4,5-dioxygenase family protein [Pseudomonadota bacterium]
MPDDRPVLDAARIEGYHAHIYYDPETRPVAEQIRAAIGRSFSVRLGRWHDKPVGPHPVPMYQVAFAVEEFPRLVPWLMLNHAGLSVLVHPETGNEYDDHAHFASWLGTPIALSLGSLRQGTRARSLSGRVLAATR